MDGLQQLADVWPLLAAMVVQTVALAKANASRLDGLERSLTRAHSRIDKLIEVTR